MPWARTAILLSPLKDLLANDPGGAAKVNIDTHFFFGDSAPLAGGVPSIATQVAYLDGLGVTAHLNDAGTSFVSFDIRAGAEDFKYFVQMGNKGTWSQADVDVTAPVPVGHLGNSLFTENFDGYTNLTTSPEFGVVNMVDASKAGGGWTGSENTELGANGYGDIATTSPDFWLDTQNSPGGINISHAFTDATPAVAAAADPNAPAPAFPVNTTSVLSFDIAKQSLDYQGTHYATATDASFEFRIDNVAVATIKASDLVLDNHMYHFDVDIASYANTGTQHTLELVDTSQTVGFTGFAVDSISIDDWIV